MTTSNKNIDNHMTTFQKNMDKLSVPTGTKTEKENNYDTCITFCTGCSGCTVIILALGVVVSACVSYGYGIKFLINDYNVFHKNGKCDGSELWNIIIGSVVTIGFSYAVTIKTLYYGFSKYVLDDEQKTSHTGLYYGLLIFLALPYHLTFHIIYEKQFDKLNGCGSVINTDLGTYGYVIWYASTVALYFVSVPAMIDVLAFIGSIVMNIDCKIPSLDTDDNDTDTGV
jgi:hypothetical protein